MVMAAFAPNNSTLDWEGENKKGKDDCDVMVDVMRQNSNPLLLGAKVRELVMAGRWDGYTVGFMHRVSEHLLAI